MEIAGEAAANAAPMMDKDIPAMKEVAKEVMETISSEVNGKNSVNGELANGGLGGSENGKEEEEEESSPEEQDDGDERTNQNGDLDSHDDNQGEEEGGNSDANGGETSKSGGEGADDEEEGKLKWPLIFIPKNTLSMIRIVCNAIIE